MKMFQIYEDDLAKLERALPQIMDRCGLAMNQPEMQVLFDEVKEIISNIRWDYGPPQEVVHIPASSG